MPVGVTPLGVAVTPDGTKVYVANCDSNNISVIDTSTNNVTATVNAGKHHISYPYKVAVGPFIDSNMTDQSTRATFNATDLSKKATPTNATDQSTRTNSAKKVPAGFNFLILAAMIVLYIGKKSTRK